MKIIILIVILTILNNSSQSEQGNYSYRQTHYYESIELKQNQKFTYLLRKNFSEYIVNGNYNISQDSLFLNSFPQRDRIIVREENKRNKNKDTFIVQTKEGIDFHYNLYLTLEDGNLIVLKNKIGKSTIKNKRIKSFYLKDNNGIRSPEHVIYGNSNNYFEIFFETKRVFENESWILKLDKIKPRDFSGSLTSYYLKK
ncbi:hypothetical protein F0365_12490 [Nonlabens sp. Ci31]|jgi:hypothetical protein|uniref:hypothetical protein n=1 Tax=Nonlabens sp. Ci31 TaxID=2608253 RepID=UPI001462B069|nr:hypothetical protein [Nonlabens sp. Ci31]QJP35147.1 hypothetical protein F0365_12490 [Nonlabens sp. Ci31]